MVLTTALLCLALNVYHEGRGEPTAGQAAIALTTMNRAEHDSGKVCNVVMAKKQFSWTNQLVTRRKDGWEIQHAAMPRDEKAWRKARVIATLALKGKLGDFTRGATHYHTKSVNPAWSRKMPRTFAYGNHVFYRDA